MLVTAAVLALVVAAGRTDPVLIITLASPGTALYGLQAPAWQSLPTELVPPAAAENAAHATVMKFQAARAVGPLVAGALLAGPGAAWALAFNAATFVFPIAAVLRLAQVAPQAFAPRPPRAGPRQSYFGVLRVPALGIAVLLTATVALLGLPIVQLTTVLAEQTYRVGAARYGVLLSAFGLGSLVGALVMTGRRRATRRSASVALSMAAFGIALLVAGNVDVYALGVLAVLVSGVCFSLTTTNLHSAIQLLASPEQRARAISLYLIALRGASALGVLALAWLAEARSPAMALSTAGMGLVAVAAVTATHPRVAVVNR